MAGNLFIYFFPFALIKSIRMNKVARENVTLTYLLSKIKAC